MQNIYPLFERNRILKKELLWSLRDYSFAHIGLEYQEYGQGLLLGCNIAVQEGKLVVGPGMVKYGGFICLAAEEAQISYIPNTQPQFLKMRIEKDTSSQDYTIYRMELLLDTVEARGENEFELCRFHLKPGAQLRDTYTSFFDMETEYDTINLLHTSWSGLDGETLAPAVSRKFAQAILASENTLPEDRSFAYLCLSRSGAVPLAILDDYVGHRSGDRVGQMQGRGNIYKGMCLILEEMNKGGIRDKGKAKEKRRILVD